MMDLDRRSFVKGAALTAASLSLGACQNTQMDRIIDTHTHFYDPFRPEGVPWPRKGTSLYRKVMPSDFLKLASPHGVTGTVVVEASAWLEDNQWILDLAKENESIVGFVGNVDPLIDDWEKHIRRFAKDKIFRGIRLKKSIDNLNDQTVMDRLKLMKDLDLALDLNGEVKALKAAAHISKSIPDYRIVVEHLPGGNSRDQQPEYLEALKTVKDLPNVYVKVSHVLGKIKGKTINDPAKYVEAFDSLWETFGEDRVIYGSNWPVSDIFNGTYGEVFKLVDNYFSKKGPEARAKYFGGNAKKAYKWIDR